MSFSIKSILLVVIVFGALIGYTLYLLYARKLSTHLAVRWALAELAALGFILLWPWLPFIHWTSQMSDRKLLLLVVIFLFIFLVFLLLYAFTHISANTRNIKLLTQEIALLRAAVLEAGIDDHSDIQRECDARALESNVPVKGASKRISLSGILIVVWSVSCVLAYIYKEHLPESFKAMLTAAYLE